MTFDDDSTTTVTRLSRDLARAAATLSDDEVRFLVDNYYIIQADRMRANAQVRELAKSGEPHALLTWFAEQNRVLESQLKNALDRFSSSHPVGQWMKSLIGVGPVISAGMLAYIDIEQAPTVGHIWRYAGLDPSMVWGKGEKRPFNAEFKVLCYKAGESFIKFSNHEDCYYGKVYKKRKNYEAERNERGYNREVAAETLRTKKIRPETDAFKHYTNGVLPPAQIHARARRYAVKLFLSHLHHKMFVHRYNKEPPMPYPIAILGHGDYTRPID